MTASSNQHSEPALPPHRITPARQHSSSTAPSPCACQAPRSESTLPPPDKSADGIGVFDVEQSKLVRTIKSGSDPENFDLSADGKLLYVSNEDAEGVSILDVGAGKVLETLPFERRTIDAGWQAGLGDVGRRWVGGHCRHRFAQGVEGSEGGAAAEVDCVFAECVAGVRDGGE